MAPGPHGKGHLRRENVPEPLNTGVVQPVKTTNSRPKERHAAAMRSAATITTATCNSLSNTCEVALQRRTRQVEQRVHDVDALVVVLHEFVRVQLGHVAAVSSIQSTAQSNGLHSGHRDEKIVWIE